MVDVVHPSTTELSRHFVHHTHLGPRQDLPGPEDERSLNPQEADETEAAWWESIQSEDADQVTPIKGLRQGAVVIDVGQLRDTPPPSSAKKALKAAVYRS